MIYYEIERREIDETPPPRGKMRLLSAAIIDCRLCGVVIAGMGGPGDGAVCERCGDALKRGELRGAVIWEEDGK